jgi:hypothetical protein
MIHADNTEAAIPHSVWQDKGRVSAENSEVVHLRTDSARECLKHSIASEFAGDPMYVAVGLCLQCTNPTNVNPALKLDI